MLSTARFDMPTMSPMFLSNFGNSRDELGKAKAISRFLSLESAKISGKVRDREYNLLIDHANAIIELAEATAHASVPLLHFLEEQIIAYNQDHEAFAEFIDRNLKPSDVTKLVEAYKTQAINAEVMAKQVCAKLSKFEKAVKNRAKNELFEKAKLGIVKFKSSHSKVMLLTAEVISILSQFDDNFEFSDADVQFSSNTVDSWPRSSIDELHRLN